MEFKITRIRKGLSQEELSQKSGIGRVTISKIENGHADSVKLGILKKIAEALNTPLAELI